MSKTAIEWVRNPDGSRGYTINPVKGKCPIACSYCYARRMYDRFKWNPEISLHIEAFEFVLDLRKRSRIFIGSTMELFGEWVKPEWMEAIMANVRFFSKHTFIFLTKQPQNLIKWSPFPENCWVGVTVTHNRMLNPALEALADIQVSKRFVSIEPILEQIKISEEDCELLDQIIIGQQTPVSARTEPKIEWIKEIVEAADRAGMPVFEKNNLRPLLQRELRQELPK